MFKQVNRRVTAVLMAMAIVLSNVVMPITPAFADGNGQNKKDNDTQTTTDNSGTFQPVWCHLTGNSWKAQLGAEPSGGRHANFKLLMTQEIKDLALTNIDNTTSNGDQVMAHDRRDKLDDFCATQLVTFPTYDITPTCGLDNDPVTIPASPSYTATFSGWSGGQGTITVTTSDNYVFTNGDTEQSIVIVEKDRSSCPVTITVLPKSTVTGVCGINNDTVIAGPETSQYYTGVVSSFANGVATVTYTAKPGYTFTTGATYIESVSEVNTSTTCSGPTKPADYTTTSTKTTTICLPGGGGSTTTWTTTNTYTYIRVLNLKTFKWEWVSILKSSDTTHQSVPASETDCPTPKQVDPTCTTFGSLTLPAYKDGILSHHTYNVWVNGIETSYSADSDATVTNIPQGATVRVELIITRWLPPLYSHTFTFTSSDCIAIPSAPTPVDPCGPNNATWELPRDTTDVHWSIDQQTGNLIATAIGGKFTDHQPTHNYGVAQDSNELCPATPVKPQITDCKAILPITAGITYKEVYLDSDGNIIVPGVNGSIAVGQGVLATANQGFYLDPTDDGGQFVNDHTGYLYTLDLTGMSCGKGDVTPPITTPTDNGVLPHTTAPRVTELPHTGASLNGMVIAMFAALSTYGIVYFAQPKRR